MDTKPGQEAAVEEFLNGGRALVDEEPATTAWFAIRLSGSIYGIFDVFPDDSGRDAHLSGRVAEALMARAPDLFDGPPKIEKVDVLATKLSA
jgi:quinol monooxygenase YgiN